jgi:hypothetical protein
MKVIQEWKTYRSYRGGVNNLAVCRLNHPGDGARAIAVGTSTTGMEAAVRNAYRNLARSRITHIAAISDSPTETSTE